MLVLAANTDAESHAASLDPVASLIADSAI